jgi:hypothetical protein
MAFEVGGRKAFVARLPPRVSRANDP